MKSVKTLRERGVEVPRGVADTRSETGAAEWEKARHKVERGTTGRQLGAKYE